jgi:hypothetical protein
MVSTSTPPGKRAPFLTHAGGWLDVLEKTGLIHF